MNLIWYRSISQFRGRSYSMPARIEKTVFISYRRTNFPCLEGGIRPDLLNRVDDILGRLDVATRPQALDLPGYHLHPLKGNLQGLWSVTVGANWRIIFRFEGKAAFDVELIDYH